jgi:hypothetical protein
VTKVPYRNQINPMKVLPTFLATSDGFSAFVVYSVRVVSQTETQTNSNAPSIPSYIFKMKFAPSLAGGIVQEFWGIKKLKTNRLIGDCSHLYV